MAHGYWRDGRCCRTGGGRLAVLFLMLFAIERHLDGILKELKEQRRDPRALVWLADIVREVKDIRVLKEKEQRK
jgi:hypothetical protein